jgi:hypothetical protein
MSSPAPQVAYMLRYRATEGIFFEMPSGLPPQGRPEGISKKMKNDHSKMKINFDWSHPVGETNQN